MDKQRSNILWQPGSTNCRRSRILLKTYTLKILNAPTGGRIAIQSLQTVQSTTMNTSLHPLLCLLQIFFQSFCFIPLFFCLSLITHRLASLKSTLRPNSFSDGLTVISRLIRCNLERKLSSHRQIQKAVVQD